MDQFFSRRGKATVFGVFKALFSAKGIFVATIRLIMAKNTKKTENRDDTYIVGRFEETAVGFKS